MLFIEKGYSKQREQGIMCVLSNRKLYEAKAMIAEIDDKAFITITQVQEVRGRGFTLEKVHYEDIQKNADIQVDVSIFILHSENWTDFFVD